MSRPRKLNLVGCEFKYLTAIDRSQKSPRNKWVCVCVCGNIVETTHQHLKIGHSCGCQKSIISTKTNFKHGGTSGGKNSTEYNSYVCMIHRCTNEKRHEYENYGGRGIKVCERWFQPAPKGFLNFLEDMGKSGGKSIDRIDVNGNYCKENCRWTDKRTQAYNRRSIKKSSRISKGTVVQVLEELVKSLRLYQIDQNRMYAGAKVYRYKTMEA